MHVAVKIAHRYVEKQKGFRGYVANHYVPVRSSRDTRPRLEQSSELSNEVHVQNAAAQKVSF